MRKILLGLLVAVAAVAAIVVSFASAATVTITIAPTGFVPRNVTITSGDTVTWRNTDTVSHQVVVDGTSCNITILSTQQGSCTFTRTGRFTFREPSRRGGAWRGTITVRAGAGSVTIVARPTTITYGGASTLIGRISTGRSGERVTVQAQPCGSNSFTNAGSVTTTTDGAWTFATRPNKTTVYRARWRNATSPALTVKVRPRVTLRKLTRGRFTTRVLAAQSFAGKVVVFQRFAVRTQRWVRVRFVVLRAGGTVTLPLNPTTLSRATFRARVRAGTRIRVVLGQAQAGTCYVASRSNVVRR